MATLAFTRNCRLMLIAPHPDDEALSCSVILQRAIVAGARVRVIYATDGENNPWPQRIIERRWRIGAAERKRWGQFRRGEALNALRALGLDKGDAEFLGLPDQGLTNLLLTNCRSAPEQLVRSIREWSPTHLLVPSIFDTHPDHNALGVMVHLILDELSAVSVWSYAVHGKSAAFFERAERIRQTEEESKIKVAAVLCHQTQTRLSARRFLKYAVRPERFVEILPDDVAHVDGPVGELSRDKDFLRFKIKLAPRLISSGEARLFLLGRDLTGVPACVATRYPQASCAIKMLNCQPGSSALGTYDGDAVAGQFKISTKTFSQAHPLFLKIERRSMFFDESGWIHIAPLYVRASGASKESEHAFAASE